MANKKNQSRSLRTSQRWSDYPALHPIIIEHIASIEAVVASELSAPVDLFTNLTSCVLNKGLESYSLSSLRGILQKINSEITELINHLEETYPSDKLLLSMLDVRTEIGFFDKFEQHRDFFRRHLSLESAVEVYLKGKASGLWPKSEDCLLGAVLCAYLDIGCVETIVVNLKKFEKAGLWSMSPTDDIVEILEYQRVSLDSGRDEDPLLLGIVRELVNDSQVKSDSYASFITEMGTNKSSHIKTISAVINAANAMFDNDAERECAVNKAIDERGMKDPLRRFAEKYFEDKSGIEIPDWLGKCIKRVSIDSFNSGNEWEYPNISEVAISLRYTESMDTRWKMLYPALMGESIHVDIEDRLSGGLKQKSMPRVLCEFTDSLFTKDIARIVCVDKDKSQSQLNNLVANHQALILIADVQLGQDSYIRHLEKSFQEAKNNPSQKDSAVRVFSTMLDKLGIDYSRLKTPDAKRSVFGLSMGI